MPIVTFTTDWGSKDHHVAAFKGDLFFIDPELRIVDISNDIGKFNSIHAAFLLKNVFPHFPDQTIHFIGITGNEEARPEQPYVVMKAKGQYFLGHDSGIFSLLFGQDLYPYTRLDISRNEDPRTVQQKLVKAIGAIIKGNFDFTSPSSIPLFQSYVAQPTISTHHIGASIIYIDTFGNAILNVDKKTFEEHRKNRPFTIHYRKADVSVEKIHANYSEVDSGELVVLFNQNEYMEMAINYGSAQQLLGIKISDQVWIEFH